MKVHSDVVMSDVTSAVATESFMSAEMRQFVENNVANVAPIQCEFHLGVIANRAEPGLCRRVLFVSHVLLPPRRIRADL